VAREGGIDDTGFHPPYPLPQERTLQAPVALQSAIVSD
jgi:hypothetical protein